MRLTVQVGGLSWMKRRIPSEYEQRLERFKEVNGHLARSSLPAHHEPEDTGTWSVRLESIMNLRALRRLAAYVDGGLKLPPPAPRDEHFTDVVLEGYIRGTMKVGPYEPQRYAASFAPYSGPAVRFQSGFDHLVRTHTTFAWFLPQDFRQSPDWGLMGSTPRLLAECERLAGILEIPPGVTHQSPQLLEAYAKPMKAPTWLRYGVESYMCVVLQTACRLSLEWGAAAEITTQLALPHRAAGDP